ncbi:MAG: DUF4394 domain-containing protein [Pseudomonadota bacterium]
MKFKKKFVALALSSLVLGGCFSDDDNLSLSAGDVFLLTDSNQLASLNRDNPTQLRTSTQLRGFMTSGEVAIGMDFRPFNGNLYVVTKDASDVGRVYTANTTTGALTFIATLVADPADDSPGNAAYTTLLGDNFGVDFNPAADALRVVSDAGQNLRIFLDEDRRPTKTAGQTITDLEINGGPANAETTGAAYTNSFDGTSSTRLFDIDTVNGRLVQQNANPGTLTDIAPLGVTATAVNGFDIDPETNVGYALLTVGGSKGLYTVRIPDTREFASAALVTNVATKLGDVNIAGNVIGLAVELNDNPTVVALTGTNTAPTLVEFSPRSPSSIISSTPITLAAGDQLLSIDFRPATGELYGLIRNGTAGRLVTINPNSGAITAESSLVTTGTTTPVVLSTTAIYNIDFNPAADRLRVVDNATTNLRINVDNGDTITDGALNASVSTGVTGTPATSPFSIAQIAYTYSFNAPAALRPQSIGMNADGIISTELFDLDLTNNDLLEQESANSGNLKKVGTQGLRVTDGATPTPTLTPLDAAGFGGFDITGGDNGARLVAGRTSPTGVYTLYDLNLSNGTLTTAGAITTGNTAIIGGAMGGINNIRDISIKYND